MYKIIIMHNDKCIIENYSIIPRIGDLVHASFYKNMVMSVDQVLLKPIGDDGLIKADAMITLRHRV